MRLREKSGWETKEYRVSMAAAAYILNQPGRFREYTRAMTFRDNSCTYRMNARCRGIFPAYLLRTSLSKVPHSTCTLLTCHSASQNAQQSFMRRGFTVQISKVIQQFSSAAYTAQKSKLIHTLLQELSYYGMSPLDFTHTQHWNGPLLMFKCSLSLCCARGRR